ncbi:hypothetical protein L6452_10950 [Arctium lappa]|uniref:Uncharacterized protein n=1 Tax=Arctium lappa TaxID=4217 RepID=A0ACB9DNV3_ARCLA|nr:hypothetical protein L6452_10950 [Arctium lappa]
MVMLSFDIGDLSESIRKPEFFGELRKAEPPQHVVEMTESLESSQSSPPENDTGHPIATPTKSTPLIPVTEIKDGTQKSKPSVIEGDDNKQRRSPASLRNSWDSSHYRHRRHRRHCHLPIKKVQKPPPETGDKEIYASESRVSRYMFHSKYIDDNNFQVKQSKQTVEHIVGDEGRDLSNKGFANGRTLKSMRYGSEN